MKMKAIRGRRFWICRNGIKVHWRWTGLFYAKSLFITWPWRMRAMSRIRKRHEAFFRKEWEK